MNQMKMFAQYGVVLLAVCLGQTAFAQSLQEGLKMMSYEKLPQAVTIFENLAKSEAQKKVDKMRARIEADCEGMKNLNFSEILELAIIEFRIMNELLAEQKSDPS